MQTEKRATRRAAGEIKKKAAREYSVVQSRQEELT